MKPASTTLLLAAILAAGTGGYWAGQRGTAPPALSTAGHPPISGQAAASSDPVTYYRDPDGRPFYSAMAAQTRDGRAFRPVLASEDVRFDDIPATEPPTARRRVLYYRNPMGLPDTSPTPRRDSMGMEYIPVYADEAEDGGGVTLSTARRQRTGVRTDIAAERVIADPLRAPGTVQLDERRVTVLATRADAFIERVADVTTGSRVAAGQALLQFYAPDIAAAGALFLGDVNGGSRDGVRGGARQRLANLGVPPETIADIERTRQVPLSMTWRAPRDGVVLQRNAVEGMKAMAGDVLFRLADLSTVWVIADMPESRLGELRTGAAAMVRPRGLPGRVFEGRVALVYPQIMAETRTVRVRIDIANPDGALLPDMYADVEIAAGDGRPVLTVPDSAVIDSGIRQTIILDKGDGRFEPRPVALGRRGGGYAEIRAGLAAGDRVVVAANFLIDAESNLKAALDGMTDGETVP